VELDLEVKLDVYRTTAERGRPPEPGEITTRLGIPLADLRAAYARIQERRLLVLEPDGVTIRMAPPFSGVETQHRVRSGGTDYFANCAWDALGIPAARHRPGDVQSPCGQSGETLALRVGSDGPEPSPWLFHCLVPAAHWWHDIVYT
jgi:Alkylmercury lyase